jgi:hypothetical protein
VGRHQISTKEKKRRRPFDWESIESAVKLVTKEDFIVAAVANA